MLRVGLDAPLKQRHSVRRIFDRLVAEHEMEGISCSTVCDGVRLRRPEIRVAAGRAPSRVFIPPAHRPGVEAEVDFGDVNVLLRVERTRCFLFTFRMSYSGKAVHRVFASCGQEAFLEGHLHAFSVLGGIPTGKVRYDNLRSAVSQVLGFARTRVENERWVACRSHSDWMLSTVARAWKGPMRRAASKVKWAVFAAITLCRCRCRCRSRCRSDPIGRPPGPGIPARTPQKWSSSTAPTRSPGTSG
ncbi:hypothetical protein ACUN29_00375 [Streptomyces sp. WC2508]|uniref:hypothetical protein n=1 Tax=Streptomyces sp. WC2508 TaxID=3461405 RepID=UPI0040440AE6